MSPDEQSRGSARAAAQLIATPEFRAARAVMLFLPLPYEIDARPVALASWQDDKTVCVPLVSYEQKHMLPMQITSLEGEMDSDHLGVRTPRGGVPFPIDLIDLVVVPGLGFDLTGRRIGRGGGFYDRFLAQSTFQGLTCGLAFEEQLVDEVPCAVHDMHVNMLVTETQTRRFEPVGAR
jgi:5-formyltetrahydrofolate cyclo-ligase